MTICKLSLITPKEPVNRPERITLPPRRIRFGRFSIPVPNLRGARIALGVLLSIGGLLGFLPILGFWMLPLGLLTLSVDLAPMRRLRRRIDLWWGRRKAVSR
jgi:hypothetical protein